jgi:DnaJ-class molecular chaperone
MNDEECGFCDGGVPLDTQEDWDKTWGRIWPGCEAPKVCVYCHGTGYVRELGA